jgi:hypothetical protein
MSVRFKRCPECGDVSLMSAPICSCCDRSYVTTARFTRKKVTFEPMAMTMAMSGSSTAASPYMYNSRGDFVVVGQHSRSAADEDRYNEYSVIAASLGLGWLGMILNGQRAKGVVVLTLFLVWLACSVFVARGSQELLLFSIVAGVGGYLVALVDVIGIANKLKSREKVGDWDWF